MESRPRSTPPPSRLTALVAVLVATLVGAPAPTLAGPSPGGFDAVQVEDLVGKGDQLLYEFLSVGAVGFNVEKRGSDGFGATWSITALFATGPDVIALEGEFTDLSEPGGASIDFSVEELVARTATEDEWRERALQMLPGPGPGDIALDLVGDPQALFATTGVECTRSCRDFRAEDLLGVYVAGFIGSLAASTLTLTGLLVAVKAAISAGVISVGGGVGLGLIGAGVAGGVMSAAALGTVLAILAYINNGTTLTGAFGGLFGGSGTGTPCPGCGVGAYSVWSIDHAGDRCVNAQPLPQGQWSWHPDCVGGDYQLGHDDSQDGSEVEPSAEELPEPEDLMSSLAGWEFENGFDFGLGGNGSGNAGAFSPGGDCSTDADCPTPDQGCWSLVGCTDNSQCEYSCTYANFGMCGGGPFGNGTCGELDEATETP